MFGYTKNNDLLWRSSICLFNDSLSSMFTTQRTTSSYSDEDRRLENTYIAQSQFVVNFARSPFVPHSDLAGFVIECIENNI